jgi:hypothetical protein
VIRTLPLAAAVPQMTKMSQSQQQQSTAENANNLHNYHKQHHGIGIGLTTASAAKTTTNRIVHFANAVNNHNISHNNNS